MNTRYALLLGAGLMFGAGAAPALAGPCSEQLNEIRKQMSAHDAGSGPVVVNTTPHPGQGATDQQNMVAGKPGAGNTVSNQAMTDATQTKAASDQDVRRQESDQPTASQQANGASGSAGGDRQGRIDSAVKDATTLDNQNDASCKTKVQEAQRLLGDRQTQ